MIKLPMVSLFAALLFLALGIGPAKAQRICNTQLSGYFSDVGGATSTIGTHLEDVSGNRCTHKWSGTLAYSGVTAEIVAEVGLTGDVERLWNEVLEGLRIADQALIKLGPDGKIGDHIKVMLAKGDVLEPRRRKPYAYTLLVEGRCNLVILPHSHPLLDDPGAMAFIMAHELFHCVQSASISNNDTTGSAWWVEGSAHWFAHMAQPNHVVERYTESANHFERVSLEKPLSAFDYSAWPFFAWVAQYRGNAGAVMLLLKGMPDAPHSNDDIAGLLSPDDWDDFAQKYSAYQIKVTDRVPVDPRPRARLAKTEINLPNIGDERDYSFIRTTGALLRYKILLSPGDWEFTTQSGGAMFISEFSGSGDPSPAWQKISGSGGAITLNVPCGSDTQYALVGFGSTAADGDFVLNAKKVGDPCVLICSTPPPGHDACFSGIWRETTVAIPDYAKTALIAAFAASGGDLVNFHAPPPIVTFFPDSDVVTVDVTGSGTAVIRGRETQLELTLGRGESTWYTSGGKLLICPQTIAIQGKITLSGGGRVQSIPFSRNSWPAGKPPGVLFDYTCDASTITVINEERNILGRLER